MLRRLILFTILCHFGPTKVEGTTVPGGSTDSSTTPSTASTTVTLATTTGCLPECQATSITSRTITVHSTCCTDCTLKYQPLSPKELQTKCGCENQSQPLQTNSVWTLSDLCPNTDYLLQLLHNDTSAGVGLPSINCTALNDKNNEIQKTDSAAPSAVTWEEATSLNETAVHLRWKAPTCLNGNEVTYQVLHWTEPNQKPTTGSQTEETQMILGNLSPKREYTFQVIVQNSMNESLRNQSGITKVRTKPGVASKPLNFDSCVTSSSTVELKWDPPKDLGGDDLDGYQIVYRRHGSVQNNTKSVESGKGSFKVAGLEPWTTYLFTIRAYHNEEGQKLFGDPSQEIENTTQPSEPSEPRHLEASNITSAQVTLTWEEPEVKNGKIDGYLVQWWTLAPSKGDASKNAETPDLNYTVRGLLPWEWYNFSVSAFNRIEGVRLIGPAVHVSNRTKPSAPSVPINLQAVAVNSSAILLKWGPPRDPKGPIDRYRIVCWQDGNEAALKNITLALKEEDPLEHTVTNLRPWTNYTCFVLAINLVDGDEEPGEHAEASARTTQDNPSVPRNLQAVNKTSQEVTLTWEVPEHPNGPLDGYEVSWFLADNSAIANISLVNETKVAIGGLQPWREYNFTVLAFNDHFDDQGTSLKGPPLAVVEKTRPAAPGSRPINLTITRVGARSLEIAWEAPNQSNGPIDGYLVNRCSSDDVCLESPFQPNGRESNLTHLEPFRTYIVEVWAFNLDQDGNKLEGPCTKVSRNTSVDAPSAPTDVILLASDCKATEAKIVWQRPDILNGPLDGYFLAWGKIVNETANTTDDWETRNCTDLKSPISKETISNLVPYTLYLFRVSAFNLLSSDDDNGTATPLIGEAVDKICRTDATAPTNPKLDVVRVEADLVEVTCQPPEIWNGLSREYKLWTCLRNCGVGEILPYSDNTQSYVVKDLLPWSNYTFKMAAFNKDKSGHLLSSANITQETRTKAGVPAYPVTNLTMLEADNTQIQFIFPKILFHDVQGPIVRYAVVVAGLENADNISVYERRHGRGHESKILTWSQSQNNKPMPPYQASPSSWNPYSNAYDPFHCQDHVGLDNEVIGKKCTIGAEDECNVTPNALDVYCNGPLHAGYYYAIKIRGFTDGGWSETHPLRVYVEPSGQQQPSSSTPVAIGVSLAILLLVGLFIVGFIMKKKGMWPPKTMATTTPSTREDINTPMTPIPTKRAGTCIPVSEFSQHVATMMSDSGLKFSQEFEELKAASPDLPSLLANLPGNKPKNRWANILPFDHSRVKLRPISDDQETDYINASYIPGNSSRREYIATQGPLPTSKDDFWRMIWEQNVSMVVMLTLCVERGKAKCEQYWRDDWEPHYHGDDCIKVVKISESILSAYTIRIFDIQMGGHQRSVKHMHFTKWPDFGCPENPEILINFVRAVRDHLPHSRPAPILVHCSAGVGRTGTFVAVDRLMQQVRDKTQHLDVYRMVLEMRDHRCSMVQTEDQYIYIHECVREIIRDEEERAQTPVPNGFEIYSNLNFNQGE